jgi:hypothetical protein
MAAFCLKPLRRSPAPSPAALFAAALAAATSSFLPAPSRRQVIVPEFGHAVEGPLLIIGDK